MTHTMRTNILNRQSLQAKIKAKLRTKTRKTLKGGIRKDLKRFKKKGT